MKVCFLPNSLLKENANATIMKGLLLGPILNPLSRFKEIITFTSSNLDYCLITMLGNVTKNGQFDGQLHSSFF
jgi:hypothetical protein